MKNSPVCQRKLVHFFCLTVYIGNNKAYSHALHAMRPNKAELVGGAAVTVCQYVCVCGGGVVGDG